jgi:hypothetical protein
MDGGLLAETCALGGTDFDWPFAESWELARVAPPAAFVNIPVEGAAAGSAVDLVCGFVTGAGACELAATGVDAA